MAEVAFLVWSGLSWGCWSRVASRMCLPVGRLFDPSDLSKGCLSLLPMVTFPLGLRNPSGQQDKDGTLSRVEG